MFSIVAFVFYGAVYKSAILVIPFHCNHHLSLAGLNLFHLFSIRKFAINILITFETFFSPTSRLKLLLPASLPIIFKRKFPVSVVAGHQCRAHVDR